MWNHFNNAYRVVHMFKDHFPPLYLTLWAEADKHHLGFCVDTAIEFHNKESVFFALPRSMSDSLCNHWNLNA